MYKLVQKDPGQGSAAAQSETAVQLADDAPDFTVENEVRSAARRLSRSAETAGGRAARGTDVLRFHGRPYVDAPQEERWVLGRLFLPARCLPR